VELAASGAIVRLDHLTELDRRSYDASMLASRLLGRRLTGSMQMQARSDLTNRTIAPTGEGTLLGGLVAARTYAANGGLAYRMTSRIDARVEGRYQNVAFDAPELSSGWVASTAAEASIRHSPATTVSVGYQFQRSEAGERIVNAHRLAATWLQSIGAQLNASLTAGASVQDDPRSAADARAFVGGAGLHFRRDDDGVDGTYQRTVGQEFGREDSNIVTTDWLTLGYERRLTSSFRLACGVRQGWSDQTTLRVGRARSDEATINARYALATGVTVGVGAFVRRRDDLAIVANRGVTFGVGYGWSELRSMRPSVDPDIR
jgi:hypothetical protein